VTLCIVSQLCASTDVMTNSAVKWSESAPTDKADINDSEGDHTQTDVLTLVKTTHTHCCPR